MSAASSPPWSSTIRRQVLQLIALLASLAIIGVGYDVWSHWLVEDAERRVNEYHLASNTHYLQAMEDLRRIRNPHLLHAPQDEHSNPGEAGDPGLSDSHYLNSQYLLDQRINKALAIDAKFDAPSFDGLNGRLRQRLTLLQSSLTAFRNGESDNTTILSDTEQLLTILEQLVRLHRISHDQTLAELHDREHLLDSLFYLLLTLLLLAGLLVSWRSFDSINRIIKRQIEAEQKIKYQAHYDGLTRLPNRSLALDRLSVMIEEARRGDRQVAVMYIDLDFFKKVNDMLGHVSGDKLLIEAAVRISQSVRAADTVGRLGGDEFIVLIGGIAQVNEVNGIAENLIEQINRPFQIESREINLSASIGISVFPFDGSEKFELIRKADTAMYHSKQKGRNTCSFFTESMNREISRKLSIEAQIHGALDRDEFEVYYQQKVDIPSGRIIGAEALLRWNNHELGPVPPDEFIPVAEQTGLIVPIGEFVLEQALGRAGQWQGILDQDFKIAVNLSPSQFRDPQLINKISRYLHLSHVSSQSLELEVTEGVLMSDYLEIEKSLAELTALGVTIAMDDFGTGYSSLSYLRKYPFGVIKIDRSFIGDIDINALTEQLNYAAISMAHALNIQVVAEGVETEAQLEVLRKLDCDIAQGYFFGKPIPGKDMDELLSSQRDRPQQPAGIVDLANRRKDSGKAS